MTKTRLIRAALLCALAVFAAGEAAAQFGGASPGSGGRRSGDSRSRDSGAELSEVTRLSANDQFRLRLASVGLALKLTPEQKVPWQAYEDKVLGLLSGPSERASTSIGENAVKQIDRKVDVVRTQLAAMQDLSDAARKLYAILSEDQKIVADRMLAGTVPAPYPAQAAGFRGDSRSGDRSR